MLYPAELRGRYLTVYLCRTADAITGEKHFNRVTVAVVRAGRCNWRAPFARISIVRLNP